MRVFLRTLFATLVIMVSAAVARPAYGQAGQLGRGSDDLSAGRQLFAEALDDEEHHRYAAALEKYQRVLKVRDTASIRYRMGITYEGLGTIMSAIDAYNAAIRTASKSAGDVEIARAAQARIDALEPKVAHLALRPNASTPSEIRVDNEPVAADAAGDMRVDPGSHTVDATAPGKQPFHAQVTLSEGGRAEIPIVFESAATPPPPPAQEQQPKEASPLRTAGIITAAAGVALVVGGVVVLVLRSNAISDLKESCPNGDCPRARQRELQDTHDRAAFQGPLGATLVGVGAAAIATGVVLYMMGPEPKTAARLVPFTPNQGFGLGVVKAF
jgi:hypothetical protein